MCRSVFHVSRLQENIFVDDEGNTSATDWKQTLQTIKWSVASLFFIKQICCRSAADLLVSYGKWASTAVSRGVHVVLAACTLFRPSTYICLFKYTILYWSFPVGICIQCDVTQYNCNYYNRAVFTWLSKGIGFGFGFGFTTPFDWLVYLLWFWFYDSQVKTALLLYIAGDGTS